MGIAWGIVLTLVTGLATYVAVHRTRYHIKEKR